jgi:uncharacterized protein (TIGR04255 family)
MPFPEVQRVIYNKNPLEKVICQLRFPPILKIDAEIPSQFQDKIRNNFPNFQEKTELKVEISPGMEGKIPYDLLKHLAQTHGNKNYEFSSEDGIWKINLTRNFLSLTTSKYERWEEFKDKLTYPLRALTDIYSPAYFLRIGLRYVDVIKRSVLNLDNVNWRELLNPYILGILAVPDVGDRVRIFYNKCEINLSDNESLVKLRTRLLKHIDSGEVHYIIDSDFFNSNKTNVGTEMMRLDYFNKRASRLIRWCITEKLHQSMEPREI